MKFTDETEAVRQAHAELPAVVERSEERHRGIARAKKLMDAFDVAEARRLIKAAREVIEITKRNQAVRDGLLDESFNYIFDEPEAVTRLLAAKAAAERVAAKFDLE